MFKAWALLALSLSACGGPETTLGSAAIAEKLTALTQTCVPVSSGRYAPDIEAAATIPVCKLHGAVFWKADMDIDCDGVRTSECNENTDPAYQDQTSAETSKGKVFNASKQPYVVIPLPSSRFNSSAAGLQLGSVVAVLYRDRIAYGPFADEGPESIIGEASHAMAVQLGIDPDPANGGYEGEGVTYVAFTGDEAVVTPIEDPERATVVGEARAMAVQ